ncbi:unnamed protein product [Mucor fragilis]
MTKTLIYLTYECYNCDVQHNTPSHLNRHIQTCVKIASSKNVAIKQGSKRPADDDVEIICENDSRISLAKFISACCLCYELFETVKAFCHPAASLTSLIVAEH